MATTGQFSGQVALLTGAASGIGRATALRLAEQGAAVALADIDADGLQQTVDAISKINGTAYSLSFNAMAETDCARIVQDTVEHYGQLNILGNIAGIAGFYHLAELTGDVWNRFLQINLTAPMILCREAMPHLLKTEGCIVNISSTAGVGGQAYNTAYVASKHGLLGLTRSLALEFAKQKVRINAICPGGVATPLNDKLRWADNMDESLVKRLFPLMDKSASAEEIAGVFAFLCSTEASFVTGADWVIDGGQTL